MEKIKLEDFLKRDYSVTYTMMNHHLEFNNGKYWMSIQCSKSHYCRPRIDSSLNDYTHFEVMMEVPREYISEEWREFEFGGVYAFVPKELVEDLINKLYYI